MNPLDITTSAIFFEKGFPTGSEWKVYGDNRLFKLRLIGGHYVYGYAAKWEVSEYLIYLMCLPDAGFASSSKVSQVSIFEERDMFILAIHALATCMNSHGLDVILPEIPSFTEEDD